MLRHVGTPRDLAAECGPGFAVRDHLELGETLGAIDMERGAKVSGARFYFLTGVGARLELAAAQRGHGPGDRGRLRPDDHPDAGQAGDHGGHRLPRRARRRGLPPRGRRPLPGRHLGGRARRATTPTRSSTCPAGPAATPAGRRASAGRPARTARTPAASSACTSSTRSRCSSTRRSEDAEAEHERLLALEEEMLALVELPYRVIDIAAGDLGSSAARKFDCEAWVPTQDRYRELTSTSNCTTFQAAAPRRPGADGVGRDADRGDAERHAGHHPLDRRDPGEPPAGRRLGAGAAGPAPVPGRPRGARAGATVTCGGGGSVDRCAPGGAGRRRHPDGLRRGDLRRGDRRRAGGPGRGLSRRTRHWPLGHLGGADRPAPWSHPRSRRVLQRGRAGDPRPRLPRSATRSPTW